MNCPICNNEITAGFSLVYYVCNSHCLLYVEESTNQCTYYWFKIKNVKLTSSKLKNFTELYDMKHFKPLLTTGWISIKTDNLPEDIPKLYKKLMKLKAFA